MPVVLRTHQIKAADAVEAAFRVDIKRPLVDACVGSGKSLIFAELAKRAHARGERSLICAHTRELVSQNAQACRDLMPGVHIGINAEALGERTWRAPVICCGIQSVFRYPHNFGPIDLLGIDEAHLTPHAEGGMYREFTRGLSHPRTAGASGTVFRLQGGSLVEGEGAPFDRVVFRYSILDGIRDGYLVPAFSVTTDDNMDPAKLRVRQGEYTNDSQDAQMIVAMDNHIAQMVHHGTERRAWLVFEASVKAAKAMSARMREWGISTGLVLGETDSAERRSTIEAFRAGRLRALVSANALNTGFDVQQVDMLVMRFKTKSLGRYIQTTGRLLRTIGGNIQASVAAGKADGIVMDFGGNIDTHGPLDFIEPTRGKVRLISCEACGKRNAPAAATCWSCHASMVKLCPACLIELDKTEMICHGCGYDMHTGPAGEKKDGALLSVPTGAALLRSWAGGTERAGGWLPITAVWDGGLVKVDGGVVALGERLVPHAAKAKWMRADGSAILVPNGTARAHARQINADGSEIMVPMPAARQNNLQIDANSS